MTRPLQPDWTPYHSECCVTIPYSPCPHTVPAESPSPLAAPTAALNRNGETLSSLSRLLLFSFLSCSCPCPCPCFPYAYVSLSVSAPGFSLVKNKQITATQGYPPSRSGLYTVWGKKEKLTRATAVSSGPPTKARIASMISHAPCFPPEFDHNKDE